MNSFSCNYTHMPIYLWATQNGIIGGIDGALAPQDQATRPR